MQHCVYILYSRSIDRYYIGCSKDPQTRLSFHNQGRSGGVSAFTKRATDWVIVWQETHPSLHSALTKEASIKRAKSRRVIERLISLNQTSSLISV